MRRRQSANTPPADGLLEEIGGGGARWRWDLVIRAAVSRAQGDVLRGEDLAEFRDERFSRSRKASGGADFQPLDLSCPHRLIGPDPRIELGTPARIPAARVPGPPWWTTARQVGKMAAWLSRPRPLRDPDAECG